MNVQKQDLFEFIQNSVAWIIIVKPFLGIIECIPFYSIVEVKFSKNSPEKATLMRTLLCNNQGNTLN